MEPPGPFESTSACNLFPRSSFPSCEGVAMLTPPTVARGARRRHERHAYHPCPCPAYGSRAEAPDALARQSNNPQALLGEPRRGGRVVSRCSLGHHLTGTSAEGGGVGGLALEKEAPPPRPRAHVRAMGGARGGHADARSAGPASPKRMGIARTSMWWQAWPCPSGGESRGAGFGRRRKRGSIA